MCEKAFDTNPRMLAVLLAKSGGGYGLAAENHALIPRRDNACQVDPYSAIAIERGLLRIAFERMMSAAGAPTLDEVGDGLAFDPEGLVGKLP